MRTSDPDLRHEINRTVAAEFASLKASFLNEVTQSITETLQKNLPVVEGKKSHKWEIVQIVLTVVVGLVVWIIQNSLHNLSDKVTTATQTITQAISMRYALTQEYNKDKFKGYQRAMERLSALENALEGAGFGAASRANAIKAYNSLDDEINRAEFYFSPDIRTELRKVISLTSSAKVIDPKGSGRTSTVTHQIMVVKTKIRDEVRAETAPPLVQK